MSSCQHFDDIVHVTAEIGEVGSHIVHILKPHKKDSN